MDKHTETPAAEVPTVQVATLQIRNEGPTLCAYIALDGKVDERHQVATISRAACNAAGGSQSQLFRAFVDLAWEALVAIVKQATGETPTRGPEIPVTHLPPTDAVN